MSDLYTRFRLLTSELNKS